MDEVYDDDQGDVSFFRQLLEMINLQEIVIDESDPALLSLRIPARRLLEPLPITASDLWARLAHTRWCSGRGRVALSAAALRPAGSPRECPPSTV
jgi:hypothetical protein